MKKNVEIKARISQWQHVQDVARTLSDVPEQLFKQEDTFFEVPSGRLKLRIFSSGDVGELISYHRPDLKGPKTSQYHVFQTSKPHLLQSTLIAALPVRGIVRKKRYLYLTGQTRIHLDQVEELGDFVELEVVLHEGQNEAEGIVIAHELMEKLGVVESDLIDQAYIDLIEKK